MFTYYKTTTIINGRLYRSAFLSLGDPIQYGWSTTENGRRRLTLPATQAEYDMYWHNYLWCYKSQAMRSKEEVSQFTDWDAGKRVQMVTTTYFPNRSQRKHNCRII